MPRTYVCSRAQPLPGIHPRRGDFSLRASWTLAGLGALMLLALPLQNAHAQQLDRVAVSDVGQPTTPACPDRGEIHGLDPEGDGFLAVRTGPGTDHEQVDALHNGDVVSLCDYRNGWHRVVYSARASDVAECSIKSDQMQARESMAEPCRSGWVHGNWVRWIWD